jgi:preprotein translocase subunit SecE
MYGSSLSFPSLRSIMSRLLKKKTPSKKKKNKPGNDTGTAKKQDNGTNEKKAPVFAGLSRDLKKRQVSGQQKAVVSAKIASGKDKNILNKAIQFLREVKVELKKVTWPSRKQTIGSTVVVIILVLIVSIFLGVIDIGLSSLVRVVLQ